jgi:hypothetical protein
MAIFDPRDVIQNGGSAVTYITSVDQQNVWLNEFKVDPIRLGRMCDKFPALQKSWEQFKITYELCRSQDDIDRQIP